MRPIYDYVIVPDGERYNDVKKIGDSELILFAGISEKDHSFTNRIGKVVGIPVKPGVIEVGDKVIVHHNTFRRWYNARKKLKDSSNLIKDNEFSVQEDQFYAYNKGNGWVTVEDFCFIKPIPLQVSGFEIADQYQNQVGTVHITNQHLEEQGVGIGDKVWFSKNSEYEFEIDGVLCYKMSATRDIKIAYGFEENKRDEIGSAGKCLQSTNEGVRQEA